MVLVDAQGRERARHRVPYGAKVLTDHGAKVTKGQKLRDGPGRRPGPRAGAPSRAIRRQGADRSWGEGDQGPEAARWSWSTPRAASGRAIACHTAPRC